MPEMPPWRETPITSPGWQGCRKNQCGRGQAKGALVRAVPADDVTHALHYLLKMLENMKLLDAEWAGPDEGDDE